MSTFRVMKNKENPYVMINKEFLSDENLSWKAKGLLAYILSLPDDWQLYESELVKHSSDGKDSLKSTIKELIERGYVVRGERIRNSSGHMGGYSYEVFENPNHSGKSYVGKSNVGKPVTTNKELKLNNNIYSHWNSKKIICHKELTPIMQKAIDKAMKSYSEEEILRAINLYAEVLQSDFFFSYKWSLTDFLNRKNGMASFMPEGTMFNSYREYQAKTRPSKYRVNVPNNNKPTPTTNSFIE